MAAGVTSKTIPQPVQTDNVPESSTKALPGAGDAPRTAMQQPVQQPQQQSAFVQYNPMRITKRASMLPYALSGLATMGTIGAGLQYIRKKRRERIRQERDARWREDANSIALNIPRTHAQYF